ncbi:hypothetical protein PRNP1_013296 [Phytophthora ramorum]
MLASNLRGGAASWYHTRVAIEQRPLPDLTSFQAALTEEFVPPDQQYRIRAALRKCRQVGTIDDYVAQFRRLIAQVRDMGQLDQIDHFCAGLKEETRKEVSYLRCQTLSAAISHAQSFERAHFTVDSSPSDRAGPVAAAATPEPMDISAMDSRRISKEACRQHRLCFYCKAPGHRIHDCPKKPRQGNDHAQRT